MSKGNESKGGRPKWIPDEESISLVEGLSGKGLTLEQIANYLGIGLTTLSERQKEYPRFAEAIKKGRAKTIANVAGALYQAVMSGNVTAMIFWLKTQAGWKETKAIEHSGKDGAAPVIETNKINAQMELQKIYFQLFDKPEKDG